MVVTHGYNFIEFQLMMKSCILFLNAHPSVHGNVGNRAIQVFRECMVINVICSDRILTCRIKSIRSPAKVGLVVTDLITSPVVSWEGWETPPPPPSTAALLSFFAQPPAW